MKSKTTRVIFALLAALYLAGDAQPGCCCSGDE